MWSVILTVSAHHGEADPRLLAWIKELLDQLIGLGPWTVVILIGLLILAMPVGLAAHYFVQQRRDRSRWLSRQHSHSNQPHS